MAAAGAGQVDQAYAWLAESAAAAPDPRVQSALREYGTALGKTVREVDADVWKIRDDRAKPAAAFELASSRGEAPVKLSDYGGKVVLLAFWFPG